MALQLTLPDELEGRLRQEAQRRGVSAEALTLRLLEEHLPTPAERSAALLAMFQQWQEEDAAMTDEESATNTEVLRAIDEDRLSDRKLFSDILGEDPA